MIRDFFYDTLGAMFCLDNKLQCKAETPECDIENKFYLQDTKPIEYKFRPQTLDEYIGQNLAKELVRITIEKIIKYKMVHILISGTKGHGKTSLANIIAKNLGLKMFYHIGGSFTFEALEDFLNKNETSEVKTCLFIDEIHNLKKEIAEFLYPVLEDFILPNGENRKLKPFLFIGATTEKATLLKKFSPLVDRCGTQINLCSYKKEDLIEILRQYNNNVYSVKIENEIYEIIAKNCRHTPRVAITYFDDYIITKDIKKVLRIHRIVKDSLTDIDFKILSYLNGVKSAGEEVLSIIAETTKQDYKQLLEPFLLTEGYITRDKTGRKILNKGIDLIKE